jgi:hypothetical protein
MEDLNLVLRARGMQLKCLVICLVMIGGMRMTVNAQPVVVSSISPNPFCLKQMVTLTGQFQDTCSTAEFTLTDGNTLSIPLQYVDSTTLTFIMPQVSQGSYFVRVDRDSCGPPTSSAIFPISIDLPPVVSIPPGNYCTSYPDSILLNIQGPSNLTYNAQVSPGVLYITSGGVIYLGQNAAPTTYPILYTDSGTCVYSDTVFLNLVVPDTAQISYPVSAYCLNLSTLSPTASPVGGTFTSTLGLSLNANNGDVDVGMSSEGTYTISYQPHPDSSCYEPGETTLELINDTLYFQYPAGPFCPSNTSQINVQSLSGNLGGIFSWDNLLAPGSINSGNGTITVDPGFTGQGPYTVTFTSNNLVCSGRTYTYYPILFDTIGYYDLDPGTTRKFCQSSASPFTLGFSQIGSAPLFPLPAQGNFSATPGVGLSIDSTLGKIFPANSAAGVYTITYQPGPTECAFVDTTEIEIVDHWAEFAYDASSYCKCVESVNLARDTGTAGGKYVAVPTGLDIDSVSGTFYPAQSEIKTYKVYYIFNDPPCNDILDSVIVTITDTIALSFSYNPVEPFCTDSTFEVLPNSISDSGGIFHSQILNDPIVDSTSGAITLNTGMSAGPRSIVYHLKNHPCPCKDTVTIQLHERESAYFYYKDTNSNEPIACSTENPFFPNTVGATPGGLFANASGLRLALNIYSGRINPSADSTDVDTTHTISYTTNGACPSRDSAKIKIVDAYDATFAYEKSSYCTHDSIAQLDPTNTYDSGGTFSCDSIKLILNDSTGVIDLVNSPPGIYIVKYYIDVDNNGLCSGQEEKRIEIATGPKDSSLRYVFDPNQLCADVEFNLDASYIDTNGVPINGPKFAIDQDTFPGRPEFIRKDLPTGWHDFFIRYIAPGGCYTDLNFEKWVSPNPDLLDLPVTEVNIEEGKPFELNMSSSEDSTVFHWQSELNFVVDLLQPVAVDSSDTIHNGTYALPILAKLTDPLSPGKMTFELWATAAGCISDTHFVDFLIVPEENSFFIPGAFTPNSDGKNDTWKILWTDDITPENYQMRLFNQGGAMVFDQQLTDFNPAGYNGNGLPDGVYRYLLVDFEGNLVQKGGVTIKRR